MRHLLGDLAALVGEPEGSWRSEHGRWQVYQQAAVSPRAQELLRRAIPLEPVPAMASAVVVMLLEGCDQGRRRELVGLLDPDVREFPERRVREIEILESIEGANCPLGVDGEAVEAWSDWLQLKVIGVTRDERVLTVLAEGGRTKKIRRLAREALARQ
jgi:hypothetical protein